VNLLACVRSQSQSMTNNPDRTYPTKQYCELNAGPTGLETPHVRCVKIAIAIFRSFHLFWRRLFLHAYLLF